MIDVPTIDVTTDTFEERVIQASAAIVVFKTQTSESFAVLSPDLEALADSHPEVVFATIDAEAEPRLAAASRLKAIPTIFAFREGNLVFREVGALELEVLEQLVQQLLRLDMAQVTRQLAESQRREQLPGAIKEVDVDQLAEAIGRHALVLDVRTPLEFASGHIADSVHIPLHDVARAAETLPRDARLYVVCKSGDRSIQACQLLAGLGFETVNVIGGLTAWQEHGHPLVTN